MSKTSAVRRLAGKKAKSSGDDFEDFLKKHVFPGMLRTGWFKRIDKLNPGHAVAGMLKGRAVFTLTARSGADWVALGGNICKWEYVAIEAKSVDGNSLGKSGLTDEQIAHLQAAHDEGQLGLLLVRFDAGVYAMRWTESLLVKRPNGESVRAEELDPALKIDAANPLHKIMDRWPR